jgi:hypothetical protein
VFDFANPDLHVARRNQTTVPQQALFFMNHPMILNRVRRMAEIASAEPDAAQSVTFLFERVLRRAPTTEERRDALSLLNGPTPEAAAGRATVAEWSYGMGRYDEETQRVENFQSLPHFTGEAWQGGPGWPDAKLGWVQLSAAGGHPGNTRDAACVRRWTAPADLTVQIQSHLIHEPAAGDGIRGFVVSSRQGTLAEAIVHQKDADLGVASLTVTKGETIDFVVDINKVLNSDQFLWQALISGVDRPAGMEQPSTTWDSALDFTSNAVEQLTPVEQLAQVLFCSNEFLFVD